MHVMGDQADAESLESLRNLLSGHREIVPLWIVVRYCRVCWGVQRC